MASLYRARVALTIGSTQSSNSSEKPDTTLNNNYQDKITNS